MTFAKPPKHVGDSVGRLVSALDPERQTVVCRACGARVRLTERGRYPGHAEPKTADLCNASGRAPLDVVGDVFEECARA